MLISLVSLRLGAVTFTWMLPGSVVPRTISTSLPLKSFMVGWVKGSNEVASPLQTASKRPLPLTSKVSWSSAVGTNTPSLSASDTVMKARSSPSAFT